MTLREIRNNSGLKSNWIAKQLGISRQQLYNLEEGKYKFSEDKIKKLSEIYRIPVSKIKSIIKGEI